MFFDFLFGAQPKYSRPTQTVTWTTAPVATDKWINIHHAPQNGTVVDLWVPKLGRVADCHLKDDVWHCKDLALTEDLCEPPTHFMFIPLGPNGEFPNED